jgi:hypothetical protein
MLLIIFEHMHITSASKEQSSYHLSSENVRKGYYVLSCEFLIKIHGAVQMPLKHARYWHYCTPWFQKYTVLLIQCLLYFPAVAVRVHDINP